MGRLKNKKLTYFLFLLFVFAFASADADPLNVAMGEQLDINSPLSVDGTSLNQGYIDNFSALTNIGDFSNTGSLTNLSSGTFLNTGVFTNDGSVNSLSNTVSNGVGGIWHNNGQLITESLDNAGTFNHNNGGGLFVFGELNSSGVFNQNTQLDIESMFNNSGTYNQRNSLEIRGLATLDNTAGSNFINHGQTIHNEGTLMTAGVFHNQFGGRIENSGDLVNTGVFTNDGSVNSFNNTVSNGVGGIWHNNGQLITESLDNAGTFNHNNGGGLFVFGELNSSGVFNQNTQLDIESMFNNSGTYNQHARLENSGQIANQDVFSSNAELENRGTFHNLGETETFDHQPIAAGTLNINGIVQNVGEILNEGTVNIESNALVYGSGSYIQTAGSTHIDGNLQQFTIEVTGGSLTGNGSLLSFGSSTVLEDVLVDAGSEQEQTGELSIFGDLDFNATLNIDVAGISNHDFLNVDDITFGEGSRINFLFEENFIATEGMMFDFLLFSSVTNIENISVFTDGLDSALAVELLQKQNSLSLLITTNVPLPSSVFMFLSSGLGLLLLKVRKKQGEGTP